MAIDFTPTEKQRGACEFAQQYLAPQRSGRQRTGTDWRRCGSGPIARAARVMAPTSDALLDFIGRALCGLRLLDA
jgi:hypothetical protein